MTNEELCQRYQRGDQHALWQLWEQNERFTTWMAWKVLRSRHALGRYDVEVEDLTQAAWFALELAAGDYDPASEYKFLTYYGTRLKTAFAEATGTRSEKQKRDPLHTARSLDAPLSEDEPEGSTLGDYVPDPRNDVEATHDRLYREWLRGFLRDQVASLPAGQAQVVLLRYWQGLTISRATEVCGLDAAQCRKLERKALDALRRRREVRELRGYVDSRTDFYRRGADPVHDNAVWREQLLEQWSNRRGTGENGG